MIKYPKELIIEEPIELKLGIKSSFKEIKSPIALLYFMWISNNKPYLLNYTQEYLTLEQDQVLKLDEIVDNNLKKYLDKYISDTYKFDEKISDNLLLKAQIEQIKVPLELVLKIAEITFFDKELNYSVERKKINNHLCRYNKQIKYTKIMDLFDIFVSQNRNDIENTLYRWLIKEQCNNSENELLHKFFTNISDEAIYRLRITEDTDIKFNMAGVYKTLSEADVDEVSIKDFKESMGSLRILNTIMKEEFNAYLNSNKHNICLKSGISKKDIENYSNRISTHFKLVNINLNEISVKTSEIDSKSIDNSKTLHKGSNILLYGVPGCGKSYTIKTQYCNDFRVMERVVFHPDYMNADFIGQILPTVKGEGENKLITYDFIPGPFTRILKKAFSNPDQMFYLIIEEVNRGNASAIFGEVFQLLDRDSDGTGSFKITNEMIAKEVFGNVTEPVYIPKNLTILATMNTADQNVFTLDTAFQRRWNMKMIRNDIEHAKHADVNILDTKVSWKTFNTEINKVIMSKNNNTLSSEDKRLGAYFITEDVLRYKHKSSNIDGVKDTETINENNGEYVFLDLEDNNIFGEKVIKYLWDDAFKFNRSDVFLDKFNGLEDVIDTFNNEKGNNRFNIFVEDIRESLVNKKADTNE